MHIGLFLLGLVTAAAGFIAIGFGIPVHAFSFGNTLIIAGTTAVVGGFLLLGIGAVVRQLKRMADANAFYGISPAANAGPDLFEAQAGFRGAGKSEPIAPAAPMGPRLAAERATESDTAIAWLRPKDAEPTFGERAVIEEREPTAAPQQSRSPPGARPLQQASQASPLQRSYATSSDAAPANAPESKWMPLGFGESQAPRPHPPRAERAAGGGFDAAWSGPARDAETVERVRKPEAPKPAADQPAEERIPKNDQAPPAKPAEGPRPVAILKTGTIDGMAYTLYADGSIEAVLPSGPIRFASVEELRAHVEKSG